MSPNILEQPPSGAAGADLLRTGFHIEADAAGGDVVLRLQGELDMATAAELRQALTTIQASESSAVTVDLAGLSFIDSTGIGVLLGGFRRAQDQGCGFSLRLPSRPVMKALRLTGVDRMLDIQPAPS